MYANDSFAFVSCIRDHVGLFVFDVSDPSSPTVRDSIDPEGNVAWTPYVPSVKSFGYLADDYGGLITLDLHDPYSISQAWAGYQAHIASDVVVDGQCVYVANQCAGLQILDVSDPREPISLGRFDTLGSKQTRTATARDSFAFSGMSGITGRRFLRVLNVLAPADPTLVAQESCYNPPEDYVLRDSLLYAVEANQFQIFNVARPREPERVGSCNSQDGVYFGLAVEDTLAYLISGVVQVIDVADPANPTMIGTATVGGHGIAVRDSYAYIPYPYDTLFVYSIANPTQLRRLSGIPAGVWPWDVALGESLLVVATADGLEAFSMEDPVYPRSRAVLATPFGPRRVVYSPPYFYAAMWEAGLGIYSVESLGVEDEAAPPAERRQVAVSPNPVRGRCRLSPTVAGPDGVELRDVTGRVAPAVVARETEQGLSLDFSKLAAGVYFVELRVDRRISSVKLVKQ